MGRTGVLTPFAILEPVSVGGVTVERATLHNEDDIRRKDIREGDDVVVQRAGDVIPQIVGPVTSGEVDEDGGRVPRAARHAALPEWRMPASCPACGSPVVRESGEVAVRCPNRSCPAQIVESIKHFVSKGAMDIDGLGEEAVAALHEAGLVVDVADLYELTLSALVDLPLFSRKDKGPGGEEIVVPGKLAENVLVAIEASKRQPFARVLYALGMRHVGSVTARALVERFRTLDSLEAASVGELAAVPGVGPVVAEAVRQYLDEPHNRQTLEKLQVHGLRFAEEAPPGAAGPLAGRAFVLTGRLETFTRGEAQARIEALGGRVSGSVGKATDYVVVGADPGSKLDKARRLGIDDARRGGVRRHGRRRRLGRRAPGAGGDLRQGAERGKASRNRIKPLGRAQREWSARFISVNIWLTFPSHGAPRVRPATLPISEKHAASDVCWYLLSSGSPRPRADQCPGPGRTAEGG